MKKKRRIAIVTDWLTSLGGAERVLEALIEMFPESPIFTSVYNPDLFPFLSSRKVIPSFLQRLPAPFRKRHQFLLPFFPKAFKALPLQEYEVVISSASAFSKCLSLREDQTHICYCHTPVRYLYHARESYWRAYPLPFWAKPFRFLLPRILDYLTEEDQRAAQRVNVFISNSNYIKKRIKKYYHRDATTIYPCTDTKAFSQAAGCKKGNYFLAVGRFIPYKRFDLLVETFKKNRLPLKLAGIGPELNRCKTLAAGAKNIEFLGFVPQEKLPELYARARAFLFPAEEDFGLTPVEAMASGTPVIAYAAGGVLESVTPETGIFFSAQEPSSLQEALEEFLKVEKNFDTAQLVKRGNYFSKEAFKKRFQEFLDTC